jgi:hypothetical protein
MIGRIGRVGRNIIIIILINTFTFPARIIIEMEQSIGDFRFVLLMCELFLEPVDYNLGH